MGTKKNVDMSSQDIKVKIVEAEEKTDEPKKKKVVKKPTKKHSKKYQAVRSKIDKSKKYDPFSAIELIKKLSYTKFGGSITAHVEVKKAGLKFNLKLPYSTGKTVKVAILNDSLIKKIENKEIDFDILLCEPKDMSKITKFARILGPKGLMPNPKNGTLTPNPALKKKELEGGAMLIKTEKKAPLIHVNLGKTSMETKELTANLQELIDAVSKQAVKISIAATMSPGVKIQFD